MKLIRFLAAGMLALALVAAALGGSILRLMTPAGGLSPEVNMMVIAGIMLILGACAVFIIKEKE